MKRFGWLVLLIFFIAVPSFAKAYFSGKKEMIERAEYIVVVEITKIESVETKAKHWPYRQKATATIQRILKGDLKGEITLYGKANFICAQANYTKGRFILFLRKNDDLLVSSNWQLGIRAINEKEKTVAWFKNEKNRFESKDTPLAQVLKEIADVLAAQTPTE